MTSTFKKENLILVHSFPTNSILLKGLINYLNDYFKVYPVDLPGFRKDLPPLHRVTFSGYSNYLDQKISALNLDSYFIGGISFGFIVVNRAKLSKNCRAVFAIEPYTNVNMLRVTKTTRLKYLLLLKMVSVFKLYNFVWFTKWWKKSYFKVTGYYSKRTKLIMEHVHPKTYLETARLLLSFRGSTVFKDLPYILAINPDDKTIKATSTIRLFKNNVPNLLIIKTKVGHYPRKVTKTYFESTIKQKDMLQVNEFLQSH